MLVAATAVANALAPAVEAARLTLHVLAAAVWVGGQITMVGLLPTARGLGAEATAGLARAFARLQWPAFVVLVATGFWNVGAVQAGSSTSSWKAVLVVKIVVVALSGLSAFLHGRSRTKAGLAIWGSVAGVTSIAALCLGVLLAG